MINIIYEFPYLDPKQSTLNPITRAHSYPIIIKTRFLNHALLLKHINSLNYSRPSYMSRFLLSFKYVGKS